MAKNCYLNRLSFRSSLKGVKVLVNKQIYQLQNHAFKLTISEDWLLNSFKKTREELNLPYCNIYQKVFRRLNRVTVII